MRLHPYVSRRPRAPIKPKKDDSQCHLVYMMERELVGISVNTVAHKDHLMAVMRNACRERNFSEPALKILDSPKQRLFGYNAGDLIVLNEGYHGCNLFTLLHELAHYFDTSGGEDHGPEWVWIYAELLSRYKIFPLTQFLSLCEEWGIEYDG